MSIDDAEPLKICAPSKPAKSRRLRDGSRTLTTCKSGDDADPTTEKAMIRGLGLDGVKAVIEGLHEMMGDLRVEVYEAGAYAREPDVWSVKFMLSGVWQQSIPQGFQAGQHVRLPGHVMAKVVDGKIVRLREGM